MVENGRHGETKGAIKSILCFYIGRLHCALCSSKAAKYGKTRINRLDKMEMQTIPVSISISIRHYIAHKKKEKKRAAVILELTFDIVVLSINRNPQNSIQVSYPMKNAPRYLTPVQSRSNDVGDISRRDP